MSVKLADLYRNASKHQDDLRQRAQMKHDFNETKQQKIDGIVAGWRCSMLESLGLNPEPGYDHDGFVFDFVARAPGNILTGRGTDISTYHATSNILGEFTITNTALAPEYRENQPGKNSGIPYAHHTQTFLIDQRQPVFDAPFATRVVKGIEFLKSEQQYAPARKARIDAEWQAHIDQQHEQAIYDNQKWHVRLERDKERQAKHQLEIKRKEEIKAEIAASINLKPDTFDYLIDVICARLIEKGIVFD